MRLHDFILTNREQILKEWDAFALTCAPASDTMDLVALRDHASEMLMVIAAELETYQDDFHQERKSKGQAPDTTDPELTAAEEHGAERAESGFSMVQIVAEYRALRASVLRLWMRECGELQSADILDLTRFNEAIDQSIAESIAEYTENVKVAKDMFLAILGHDLRNPLGAIYTSAMFLHDTDTLETSHQALALRIADRAMHATQLVGDLLDFTRSNLGGGIPVNRDETDLNQIVHEVVDEILTAHPGKKIQVESSQEQVGQWDAARIRQVLSNLVGNAVEHGDSVGTIQVKLDGDENDVTIMIHNQGPRISAERLDGIFNPMKISTTPGKSKDHGPTGNLGLGLYIAERIVHAHGGRIEVESSDAQGTSFTVHLPRNEDQ